MLSKPSPTLCDGTAFVEASATDSDACFGGVTRSRATCDDVNCARQRIGAVDCRERSADNFNPFDV